MCCLSLEGLHKKYHAALNGKAFRQRVVNLLIEWWEHAVLGNNNELRVANIMGEKSKKGKDNKKRSGCGSLSVCVNVDSDKFLFMRDFANPLISSRSPLVTLLKILAGLRGVPERYLEDNDSLAWKTSKLCEELDEVLEGLLIKSTNEPIVEQTKIPKANIKFTPTSRVEYPYFDRSGNLIMTVVREENLQGLKRIYREKKRKNKLKIEEIPLYNLKNLFSNTVKLIVFVEGEKCAEAVQALLPNDRTVWVTTIAGGANSRLQPAHLTLLKEINVKVVWLPDLSKAGFKYAFDNHQLLIKEGVNSSILAESELLKLYGASGQLEDDYDISDFLDSVSKESQPKIVCDLINLCVCFDREYLTYESLFSNSLRQEALSGITSAKKIKTQRPKKDTSFKFNVATLSNTLTTVVRVSEPSCLNGIFKELTNLSYCGLDIETTGLNSKKDKISLMQIYNHKTNICYVFDLILNRDENTSQSESIVYNTELLSALSHHLKQTGDHFFVAASAGFESAFIFNQLGVTLKILCVQVLESFVVTHKIATRDLSFLVNKYFDLTLSKELQTSNWHGQLSDAQYEYAALDAVYATKVFEKQKNSLCTEQVKGKMWEGYLSICSCLRTYKMIEECGVNFDKNAFNEWVNVRKVQREELEQFLIREIQPSNKKLTASTIVNWMKKEHSELLPYFGTTSKSQKISVSRESIAKFERECRLPLPNVLKKWLLLEKIKGHLSDFAVPITKNIERYSDGKLHTDYFVGFQITGRVSATEFALNLLPKKNAKGIELRNLVIPSPGNKLLVIDIAQQESLFFALIVNAREQLNRMRQNLDMHAYAASNIYRCDISQVTKEQRRFGKLANLALSYGMGAKKFQSKLSLEDERSVTMYEASNIRDGWHRAFSELSEAQKSQFKLASERGYAESKRGRRRTWLEQVGYSASINFPVQATAADFLYLLIEKLIENNLDQYLIGTAHDEIILDIPQDKVQVITDSVQKIIKNCMIFLFPEQDVNLWEQLTLTEVKVADSWSGELGIPLNELTINEQKTIQDVNKFKVQLTNGLVEVEEKVLPEGVYQGEIIEVNPKVSNNGNPMAVVDVAININENEPNPRVVIVRDWLVWNKTGGIMKRTVQKVWDILLNTQSVMDAVQLKNKRVLVQIKEDFQEGVFNNVVVKYFEANSLQRI